MRPNMPKYLYLSPDLPSLPRYDQECKKYAKIYVLMSRFAQIGPFRPRLTHVQLQYAKIDLFNPGFAQIRQDCANLPRARF